MHEHAIFPPLKMKLQVRESPEAAGHRSDLDIIRPEYKRPSGFFGVRTGTCIRQNTVYIYIYQILQDCIEMSLTEN